MSRVENGIIHPEIPAGFNERIKAATQMLQSEDFIQMTQTSNLPQDRLAKTLELISYPVMLERRAVELFHTAEQSLKDFYGEEGDILIPFSGGYDSTLLAFMTYKLFKDDPTRNIHLVTAVTGMEKEGLENAGKQATMLEERVGIEIDHRYLDLSPDFGKHVIDSSYDDSQRLGYPSFCSSCKVVMERAMAQTAEQLRVKHIAWGYNDFQASLQWPEQHIAQRQAMAEYFNTYYPDLNIGSPFFDVVKYPTDPILLFAVYGLPIRNKHGEARCYGAGTNPDRIEGEKLKQAVRVKNEQLQMTTDLEGKLTDERPKVESWGLSINQILEDSRFQPFLKGRYDEEKSGHLALRDQAYGPEGGE